ncbi:MAG: helix-turn-helix domain containing protein [Holophaga sp.]|nr:helix-turn-helix domain containing protein [Holophaga sp.]
MGKEKDRQILEAATSVFLRYGFRRATMGDIAQEAGVSRPALYLRFCNKEHIFQTVLGDFAARTLEQIRAGLPECRTPMDQLHFAFECWAVGPFTLMQGSPDARDLTCCNLAFAETVKARNYAAFEELLVPILRDLPAFVQDAGKAAQVAHVLAVSVHGFTTEARDADELRGMIDTLLGLAV